LVSCITSHVNHCGKSDILFKNDLTLTKEIIIIRLNIFSLQDKKLEKILQKFNLSIGTLNKFSLFFREN